jgi:hypothetical protein
MQTQMPLDVFLPRSDAERPDLGTSQMPNPTSIRLITISATMASDAVLAHVSTHVRVSPPSLHLSVFCSPYSLDSSIIHIALAVPRGFESADIIPYISEVKVALPW